MTNPAFAAVSEAPARLEIQSATYDHAEDAIVVVCAVGAATAVLRASSWRIRLSSRVTRLKLLPRGVGATEAETLLFDIGWGSEDVEAAWAADPDAAARAAVASAERILSQPDAVCRDGSSGEDLARLVGSVLALVDARPGCAEIEAGCGREETARASVRGLYSGSPAARDLILALVEGANPIGWTLAPVGDDRERAHEGQSPVDMERRTIPIPEITLTAHGRMAVRRRLREIAKGMEFRPGRVTALQALDEFDRRHEGER